MIWYLTNLLVLQMAVSQKAFFSYDEIMIANHRREILSTDFEMAMNPECNDVREHSRSLLGFMDERIAAQELETQCTSICAKIEADKILAEQRAAAEEAERLKRAAELAQWSDMEQDIIERRAEEEAQREKDQIEREERMKEEEEDVLKQEEDLAAERAAQEAEWDAISQAEDEALRDMMEVEGLRDLEIAEMIAFEDLEWECETAEREGEVDIDCKCADILDLPDCVTSSSVVSNIISSNSNDTSSITSHNSNDASSSITSSSSN